MNARGVLGKHHTVLTRPPPTEVYSDEDEDYYRKANEHSLYHSALLYNNDKNTEAFWMGIVNGATEERFAHTVPMIGFPNPLKLL